MKLDQTFTVQAAPEVVWDALIDVARVAPCLPGAQITGDDGEGSYKGEFKVKLGPTTAAYNGALKMESLDTDGRVATMSAKGTDKRGAGGATATIVSSVHADEDGGARVDVSTDFSITGRLARFGRGGMVQDVANRLLREFAANLQDELSGDAAPAVPAPAGDAGLVGAAGPPAPAGDAGIAGAAGPPAPAGDAGIAGAAAGGGLAGGAGGAPAPTPADGATDASVSGNTASGRASASGAVTAGGGGANPSAAEPAAGPPAPAGDAGRAGAAAGGGLAGGAGGAPAPASPSPGTTGGTGASAPPPKPRTPRPPAEPVGGIGLAAGAAADAVKRQPVVPFGVGVLVGASFVALFRVRVERR